MSPSALPPSADLLTRALGAFWATFAAVSVAGLMGDAHLAPGLSRVVRSVARRGKDEDGEDDGVDPTPAVSAAQTATPRRQTSVRRRPTWHSRLTTVPHAWFSHFYVVGTAWNALVLMHALAHAEATLIRDDVISDASSNQEAAYAAAACVLVGVLFQVHVTRRLVESVFVSSYRQGATMHVLGYAVGVVYYLAAPLTLASPAAAAAIAKSGAAASGALGATPLVTLGDGFVDLRGLQLWMASFWDATPFPSMEGSRWLRLLARVRRALRATNVGAARSGVGAALFIAGNLHQNRYHRHLAALRGGGAKSTKRDEKAKRPTSGDYGVPRGGWFDAVSCPHYAAEVVLYVGLAIASGPRVSGASTMVVAVAANLALAARENHAWYLRRFPEYPKNRCAMIPGIW